MREHTPPRKDLAAALGYIWEDGRKLARIGFGGHAFDANGVCIYCSCCVDRHCCGLRDKCPNDEPRPKDLVRQIDGSEGSR